MSPRRKSRGTEKHRKEFLSQLASAIIQWQYVETELFFIFAALVQGRGPAMSAVFHSVVNFNARLDMIDDAAAVMLAADPLLPEWEKISAKVAKRAKDRNKLVHFTLMGRPSKAADAPPVTLYISQSIWDFRAQKRLEYDLKQIETFVSLFDESRQQLADFRKRLKAALDPSLQKLPEQPPYETSSRVPRFRIPKARERPPRSSPK